MSYKTRQSRCNAEGRVHVSGSMHLSPLPSARRKSNTLLAAAALIVMIFLTPGASAQRVSLGVVVGGYANRDFDPGSGQPDSGGYIVGPSFDLRFFPQLSLGVEALYKPLHFRVPPFTVVTWQFPVLARYKFALGRVRPLLEAGPSFRSAGNLNGTYPSHFGASVGVGFETQWQRVRIAPRVRYTRWAEDRPTQLRRTRSDQLEFWRASVTPLLPMPIRSADASHLEL